MDDSELFEETNAYLKKQLDTNIFIHYMILNTVRNYGLITQLEIIRLLKNRWSERTVRKYLYILRIKRSIICENKEEIRENFYRLTPLGSIKLWQLKKLSIDPQFDYRKVRNLAFLCITVFLTLCSFLNLLDLSFLLNFKFLILVWFLDTCCIIVREGILDFLKNKDIIIYYEYADMILKFAYIFIGGLILTFPIYALFPMVFQQSSLTEAWTRYSPQIDIWFPYFFPIFIIYYFGTQYIYEVKKSLIWLPPFTGGLIILISLLFPSAIFLNSINTIDTMTYYTFIWLWALISTTISDSPELYFVEYPIMLYISILSTILLFFCGISMILISTKLKKKEITAQKAKKFWRVQGYLVMIVVIMYCIMMELWYLLTFQTHFWGTFAPSFGVIGPIFGAFFTLLHCKFLKT